MSSEEKAPILESGAVFGQRYRVVNQLKHYKEVFNCVDEYKNNEELIVKVEQICDAEPNRLQNEWRFYRRLSTTECFNFVVDYLCDHRLHYLLMRPLGENLHSFYCQKKRQKEWSLQSVVTYADGMLSRVANCHLRNVIHRDIKPENFVVDSKDNDYLYLIDFNLAKEYSTLTVPHIPYRRRSAQYSVGNVQFLSVNAHKGEEQSRRDDLISIGYSLIFLAKGRLPWSGLHSKHFESRLDYVKAVGDLKMNCSVEDLCHPLPEQFAQYMKYCLELKFEEKPNYLELRQLFSGLSKQLKSSDTPSESAQSQSTISPKIGEKCRKNLIDLLIKYKGFSSPMKCP